MQKTTHLCHKINLKTRVINLNLRLKVGLDIYFQSFMIFSLKVSLQSIDVLDIMLIPLRRLFFSFWGTLCRCYIYLNQPFFQLFPTFTEFHKNWALAQGIVWNFAPKLENLELGNGH